MTHLPQQMTHHLGRVTWFDPEEGYGFLACTHEADIFTDMRETNARHRHLLKAGDRVRFQIVVTDVGVKASSVVKLRGKTTVAMAPRNGFLQTTCPVFIKR